MQAGIRLAELLWDVMLQKTRAYLIQVTYKEHPTNHIRVRIF